MKGRASRASKADEGSECGETFALLEGLHKGVRATGRSELEGSMEDPGKATDSKTLCREAFLR